MPKMTSSGLPRCATMAVQHSAALPAHYTSSTSQSPAQARNVFRTHADWLVASEMLEAVLVQLQRDQRNVARVHGLQAEVICRAIEVRIRNKVFDSLYHAFEQGALQQACLKHRASTKDLALAAVDFERQQSRSTVSLRAPRRLLSRIKNGIMSAAS